MMRLSPSNDGSRSRSVGAAGRSVVVCLLVALASLAWARPAAGRQGAELPTDPALVQGELASGVAYMIRPTGSGDSVVMRLLVPAGAIYQGPDEAGLADVVHHLVASGLDAAPEGVEPGGYITLDASHFMARIVEPTPDRLDAALSRLAGALETREFGAEQTQREARAAASRTAGFENPDSRVQRMLLERLGLERIARSLPAPGMQAEAVTPELAEAFHRARYAPGSATVVIVGGVDPGDTLERLDAAFGDLPAREAPALDWSPAVYEAPMGAVVADAELADCDVDIVALAESPNPPSTYRAMRRELVRAVALRALERRLKAASSKGAPFDDATAHVIDIVGLARMYNVFVSGAPESWEAMLSSLVAQVRTIRETGFDPVEIERAAEDVLSDLHRAEKYERADPIGRMAGRLAFAAASGRAPMSLEQRMDLTEAMLLEIFAPEAADAIAEMFDSQRIAYALSIPAEAAAGVDADRVLASARSDEKAFEADREELLARIEAPTPETPGAVSSLRMHPESGVLTAVLTNSATVHHRRMDDPSGAVHVTVTLAGGRIEERPETRGLTDAAALGLSRPATGSLTSSQVRDLLSRSKATLDARLVDDALALRIEAAPGDLETALRTLYGLLSDARIEPAALDAWRRARVREARERKSQPFDALRAVLPEIIFRTDEARVRPLEPDELESITLEATQAWLDRLLATAPIEIGVAGPIDGERALSLVASTLGALPAREAIDGETLDQLRSATRAAPPYEAEVTLESKSEQALTLLARFAPPASDTREVELIEIATAALDARLERLGRGRPGLVYSLAAGSRPARVYPEFGLVYAVAAVTGERQDEFTRLLEREWALFLAGEIDDEAALAAREALVQEASEELISAGEWSSALASLVYRGRDLDTMLAAPSRLSAYTPDAVRNAARRCARSPAVRILIRASCPERAGERADRR